MSDILPYYLLVTKGYNITVDYINQSCPKDLEPYVIAYKKELERQDESNWCLGLYIKCAVKVSLEEAFLGQKAKAKYYEKPILMSEQTEVATKDCSDFSDNRPMTEEELQIQRGLYVKKLQLRKRMFDKRHKKDKQIE